MEKQNDRRSFLKYMCSLSAFIAGSTLSFNRNKGVKTGRLCGTEALGMGTAGGRVKKIAVEEHFYTEKYIDWLRRRTSWEGSPSAEAETMALALGKKGLNIWMKQV